MVKNPLRSHIPDQIFDFLVKNNLLSEKGVRDFKSEHPTRRALEILQSEYPYLQYETIRKIIYKKIKLNSPEYFYLF